MTRLPLLALLAFACCAQLFGQNTPVEAVWPVGEKMLDLQPQTLYFPDSSFLLKAAEVLRHPMRPLPKKDWLTDQIANGRVKYWLLLALENPSPTDTLRLVFSPGRHARSEAFWVENNTSVRSLGTAGWLNREPNRPWAANVFGLGIELLPAQKARLLVSVEDRYRFYDNLLSQVWSPKGFIDEYHRQRSCMIPLIVFMALVVGGLGLLALFVFSMYLGTSDRSPLWYCAYELAMCALYLHGLHYYLTDFGRPMLPLSYLNKSHPLLQLLVAWLYARFIEEFLNLRGQKGFAAQGIRWTVKVTGAMVLLFLPWPFIFEQIPPQWGPVPFAVSYFLLTFAPPFILVCLLMIPGKLRLYPLVGTALLMVGALTAVLFLFGGPSLPQHETGLFDTNRFYAGICILLEAIVFALGLGYRLRHLAHEKEAAQEDLLTLRANVSQDLHDDLGSELSSMSLSAYSASRSGDSQRMAASLSDLSTQASKLVEDMRDIVWAMNPVNDSMTKLADRMRAFAARLFDERGTRLHFRFSEKTASLNIQPEARKQVYLFYKEALNNAARHAQAANVFVEMTLAGNQFLLEIRDDGQGFSPKTASSPTGGNGLRNLRRRAESLGGQLEIESAEGAGTAIRLRAALGQ